MHTENPENACRRNVRRWLENVNWDNGLLVGHRSDENVQRNARTADVDLRGIELAMAETTMYGHTHAEDTLPSNLDGQGYQPQQPQSPPSPSQQQQQQHPEPDRDPEAVLSLAPDGGNDGTLNNEVEDSTLAVHQQQTLSGPRQPTTDKAEDVNVFALAGMGAQFDTKEG